MRKAAYAILVVLLAAGVFLAGSWHGKRGAGGGAAGTRKVLHYVDPMHPAYKSDKPGIAPDCGMQLEPVYADGGAPPGSPGSSAGAGPGAVRVGPERQQMVGIQVAPATMAPYSHTLRVTGKVVPDERRVYVINATVDGWITKTRPNSTGSVVRKDETLATFYSPEFLSAVQALLFALNSMDRVRSGGHESQVRQDQMAQFNINLKQYKDSLRNLGMGDRQVEELIRTRKFMESVDITAPADGFVLARNVFDGMRFDKGTEMYRIADLERVWILADVHGDEARHLEPGLSVRASVAGSKTAFQAKVSDVPPRFDAATRTLKVRLEAENRRFLLRPDMFVDVELPVHLPPAIAVPADAVIDSGLRKTVYVDRGNGLFEPRTVEMGWRVGDRVEIVRGISPGERIVVSGNFLIDSESRMKLAAAGIYGAWSLDPVCGMQVDEGKARAAGRTKGSGGTTYFFCSDDCVAKFSKNPAAYAAPEARPTAARRGSAPAPAARDHGPMHAAPRSAGEHGKMHATAAPAAREEEAMRGVTDPAPGDMATMHAAPATAGGSGAPGSGMPAAVPVDPICGMQVDAAEARAAGRVSEHMGTTYFFCADGCRRAFDADPGKSLAAPPHGSMGAAPGGQGGHGHDAPGGSR